MFYRVNIGSEYKTFLDMKALSHLYSRRSNEQSLYSAYAIEVGICLLLLLVAIAINLRMLRAGINGLGDARWHLTWIQHFSHQVLTEGDWYPRWLSGTNFGYGSPTFVFYPPLVYYLSTALKAVGLTIEQTVYVLLSGGIFLSGISFYVFGRTLWGRYPAIFGAIAYMVSPGIFGLVHGGGFASLYAYVWAPLILLFTHLSIQSNYQGIYRLCLSLVWTFVALTHLPSLLIFAIAWTFYTLPLLWHRSWQVRLQTWIAAPLGWGLAAVFIIPAILEQSYINIDYMLASQDGFRTEMPRLIEVVGSGLSSIFFRQWLACIAFAAIAIVGFIRQPQKRRTTGILLAVALFIVFLICDWSWPLWQINPIVQKIELSTRLDRLFYIAQAALCALAVQSLAVQSLSIQSLSIQSLFTTSTAIDKSLDSTPNNPRKRFTSILLLAIICAILLSNFKYSYQLSKKFPGLYTGGRGVVVNRAWIERILRHPFDEQLIDVPEYRPRLEAGGSSYTKEEHTSEGYPTIGATVLGAMPTPQPNQPRIEIASGQADFEILDWRSDRRRLVFNVQEPAIAILRTYTYPAWQLYVDELAHPIEQTNDGRIQFQLPTGRHEVTLAYEMTLALKLGLIASGLSAIAFIGLSYHWITSRPDNQ